MKIIKFLKSIKPIYIILCLLVVVLIVSALGSKTKEGMSSGLLTSLRNYRIERDEILNDINFFIKVQGDSSAWGSSLDFKRNFDNYYKILFKFRLKQFFINKDLNADGAVVVKKSDGTFIRDNSGNVLDSDEKLYYYDLVAQDKNSDSRIVSFKNRDQGNFYRDNVDNSGNLTTTQSLSNSPYILESIDRNDTVTQTKLNAAKLLLDNQINLLNSTDKTTINTSIASLINVIDRIVILTNSPGGGGTNADLYIYDPDYIPEDREDDLDEEDEVESEYQRYLHEQILKFQREQQYNRNLSRDLDWGDELEYDYDYEFDSPVYSHQRRRDNTRINDNGDIGASYWKNLYLNSLNSMSGQQTPVYGSLLSGNNSPYDAGDASSGTGTGNGIKDTSNYDITAPPVQSSTSSRSGSGAAGTGAAGTGAAGTGAAGKCTTGDAYLLNNSQNSQPTNCPVGGSVTANSAPNNCRPATVPPCPPCERCPEPKFDCKRVPKYNSSNNQYLPKPVLSDFSQFAM